MDKKHKQQKQKLGLCVYFNMNRELSLVSGQSCISVMRGDERLVSKTLLLDILRDWKYSYIFSNHGEFSPSFSKFNVDKYLSSSLNIIIPRTSAKRFRLSRFMAAPLNLNVYKGAHGFWWSGSFRNHCPAFHWWLRTTEHDTSMARTYLDQLR